VVVFALEARAALRQGTLHPPSSRTTDAAVLRSLDLNPMVLLRLSAEIPNGAAYDLHVDASLARTVQGQAFVAWVRSVLLPRLEISRARWHIVWSYRPAVCCHERVVGRLSLRMPPVVITHE
jgi:hypothetical protein